jgi:hypothetical protein
MTYISARPIDPLKPHLLIRVSCKPMISEA